MCQQAEKTKPLQGPFINSVARDTIYPLPFTPYFPWIFQKHGANFCSACFQLFPVHFRPLLCSFPLDSRVRECTNNRISARVIFHLYHEYTYNFHNRSVMLTRLEMRSSACVAIDPEARNERARRMWVRLLADDASHFAFLADLERREVALEFTGCLLCEAQLRFL